ncbi:MAG: hypothetical protein ABUT20_47730 [Bacteroidota bacterium]
MMKPLRKRHLLVWRVLALLLPAGIIIAWLSVPEQIAQPLLQPGIKEVLPVILKKFENKNYSVAIRSNNDTTNLQLEWINKTILQFPTATIYEATGPKDIKEARLIGRIEARGNWYFPLDSTFKSGNNNHFLIYDFIHQQIIDTIKFKP